MNGTLRVSDQPMPARRRIALLLTTLLATTGVVLLFAGESRGQGLTLIEQARLHRLVDAASSGPRSTRAAALGELRAEIAALFRRGALDARQARRLRILAQRAGRELPPAPVPTPTPSGPSGPLLPLPTEAQGG